MPNRFEHRVTRGAVRLVRRWESSDEAVAGDEGVDAVVESAVSRREPGAPRVRDRSRFSARSRSEMRYQFSGLPWEMLGLRPAMLTTTYPADWRAVAPDARAVVRQREALKERWRYQWGAPVGIWVVEFQPRLRRPPDQQRAPHLHFYLGLPEAVEEDEYRALLRRTFARKRLERRFGKYEGRRRTPPPEGPFSDWLLRSWSEIVGTGGTYHRERGADITPAFWSESVAEAVDRTQIAEYFWRESGKWGQKTPPDGFGHLRFYGRWGSGVGFEPFDGAREIDRQVFVELRRLYRKLIRVSQSREAEATGMRYRAYRGPRGLDGLTAFVSEAPSLAARAEAWAMAYVAGGQSNVLPARSFT